MTIPNKIVAPNLPLPPQEYEQFYLENVTKVLRLYFNNLDSINLANTDQISTNQTLIWLGV
jgi:hypothetical protein